MKRGGEKSEEALQYESRLPIAHYRLVFLEYSRQDYLEVTKHFGEAIRY